MAKHKMVGVGSLPCLVLREHRPRLVAPGTTLQT